MCKAFSSLMTLCFLNAVLAGCTVYKSSDRDDFNSNGKAKAPIQSKGSPLSVDDLDLLSTPCAAFTNMREQDLETVFGISHLSMTNQNSPKTSTCLVQAYPYPDLAPALAAHLTADLTTFSILSCSWKPVDGAAIRDVTTADAATDLQTTEDDLHEQGFSVVSATAVSGTTLRMNCEGYAPTDARAQDARENFEKASDALSAKFAAFAALLKLETLATSGQH